MLNRFFNKIFVGFQIRIKIQKHFEIISKASGKNYEILSENQGKVIEF